MLLSMYLMKTHFHDFFQILSDGGHPTTAKNREFVICGSRHGFLQDAYGDATSRPFGYLLLDINHETPNNCRFRSCIFPDDEYNYVYVSKKRNIKSGDDSNDVPVVNAL